MRRLSLNKIKRKFIEYLKHRYLLCRLSSFKIYAKHHTDEINYFPIESASIVDVVPVSYIDEKRRGKVGGILAERYIAHVYGAKIIGDSSLVISDNNTILNDMLYENNPKFNFTDKGLFRILDTPVSLGRLFVVNYIKSGRLIDKAICLTGNYSKNFYHFMYEILSKSYLFIDKDEYLDYPIIVSSYVRDIPQFNELSNIFLKNRRLIYVDSEELVHVKELVFPSFCNTIPPNYININDCIASDVVFDLKSLEHIRTQILEYAKLHKPHYPKKFFISRRATSWRNYNEEEVIKVVKEYGFEVVYPEELSYLDQVCLFRDAEYIIAASGAALTNLIACGKWCRILTFVSARLDLSIFSTIADFCEVNIKYMVGTITNDIGVQSDFTIDTDNLKEYLKNG